MSQCGINDARSVRRTINTIRRKVGCTQCVVTLNQEFYGHLNGSSNGQYDLNGYKIPQEIERISNGTIQLNNNNDCIWSNIRDDLKTWLQNRFTT
jgi:protein-arginine kinase activator protein McsA